jgi:hypothetical protein
MTRCLKYSLQRLGKNNLGDFRLQYSPILQAVPSILKRCSLILNFWEMKLGKILIKG